MNAQQSLLSRMQAITISRTYGSGGGEIARRLAERLQWHLVDHEVVEQVAREMGISEEAAEAHDERADSLLGRILTSMQGIVPAVYPAGYDESTPPALLATAQDYQEALTRVVNAAVEVGHVVIVGRGGQMILAPRRDVLHIRITAPLEKRIPYVMRREGLTEDEARARIQSKDRDRERYLQTAYHQSPSNSELYDLAINTGILDLDSAVELVLLALERKARLLAIPSGELGPGANAAPYPGRPADFHPPAVRQDEE